MTPPAEAALLNDLGGVYLPLLVLLLAALFGAGWCVFYVGRALVCWIMDVVEENDRKGSGR